MSLTTDDSKYYMNSIDRIFETRGGSDAVKIAVCSSYIGLVVEKVIRDGRISKEKAILNLEASFQIIKEGIEEIPTPADN